MLWKFVNDTGWDWDQLLSYILFAYSKVPQASTGFSPFELLYTHEVTVPLSLLKEIWEGDQGREMPVNIISYVVQMRDRLEKMGELAQTHMAEAQQWQRAWYNQSYMQRSFDPGQKLLVILPSDDSKLLAKWQGPYKVIKRLGPRIYHVFITGQQYSSKVVNVNLLKERVSRSETKAEVLLIRVQEKKDAADEQYLPSAVTEDLNLSHLPDDQQSQVQSIV